MNKSQKNTIKNLRTNILKLSHKAKSSHIGGCLSIVEILSVLFNNILKGFSSRKKTFKDTFILSKGHACLALYCMLYEKKILSKKILFSYGENNSLLMSHASHHVPGVKFSTGSLGHGLPVAIGSALVAKNEKKNRKVYVLISDGELNEGTTWESLMFAAHHKIDNLCVIIDYNKLQSLTFVSNTIKLEPLTKKIKSFGCEVKNINGHNITQLKRALIFKNKKKPRVVIANTIKGKGISFMENNIAWHYKSPNFLELSKALKEVNDA
jgi:transketolase|tara:strand:+ start:961 stop:1761 length:801 start_codon:yes stop_codon:yes gene_type:complete